MILIHKCPNCEISHEQNCVPSNDSKEDNLCADCEEKGYQKYFVSWLDSYNTHNHAEYMEREYVTNFAINKRGLKSIKESFAVYEIEGWDYDGWVDCSHLVIICAKDETELNEKVQQVFENNGRNIDVFSVRNEDKTIDLTEEDFLFE